MTFPEIEYYGYLTAASGLGVAARGYLKALQLAGYKLSCHDLTPLGDRKIPLPKICPKRNIPNKNSIIRILHVNAEELPRILRIIPTESSRHIYQIGIWAWETENFPDKWINRYELVDEIWTGSTFMATAIGNKTHLPVKVIPHVVEVPATILSENPPTNGVFTFFFSFDYRSVAERKNPLAIINIFKKSFNNSESVHLKIKSSHEFFNPNYANLLKKTATGFPIDINDEIISDEEHWLLIKNCNAYVSLHRSEGFGLGMAEAMGMGKPVMATTYGGNCDYMHENNSVLVPYKLITTSVEYPPYPVGTLWAEIDDESAIKLMRRLYYDDAWRDTIERNAKVYMTKNHSPEAIAMLIQKQFNALQQTNFLRSRKPHQASKTSPVKKFYWNLLRGSWYFLIRIFPTGFQHKLNKIRFLFK